MTEKWISLREIPIEKSSKDFNSDDGERYDFLATEEKSYLWDKLDEIFQKQLQFTNQIDGNYKDQSFSCYHFDKLEFDLYDDLNCAIQECCEAIKELNTKKWKKQKKEVDRKKVLIEIVDATKFLHQAVIRLGYNSTDFYEAHKNKGKENDKRQKEGY